MLSVLSNLLMFTNISPISLQVYTVVTGITVLFLMLADLLLGIRMAILVLESVRKEKIAQTLKPNLIGTVSFIILIDALAVICVLIGGVDAGLGAILLGLLHILISFQLLVVLQQGVKANPEMDSSSGRVVTGKATAWVDPALIATHISHS